MVTTLPSKPYITEMKPVGLTADGGITYGMTGMFAEIFDNLQVSLISHILVMYRLWFFKHIKIIK